MLARKLIAILGGSIVMTISGVAFSDTTPPVADVTLTDFDGDILYAILPGSRIGYYRHTIFTQHLPGNVGKTFPPNPCYGYTRAWNALILRGADTNPTGREQFHTLLTLMARSECPATIVSTPSTDTTVPSTIDSITPR